MKTEKELWKDFIEKMEECYYSLQVRYMVYIFVRYNLTEEEQNSMVASNPCKIVLQYNQNQRLK